MEEWLKDLIDPWTEKPLSICTDKGKITEIRDGNVLGGKYVLPGFVDSHCHILPTGLDLLKLHLGQCESHNDILQAVLERHELMPRGEWLHAVHYDQTKFPDGAHLTKTELDNISTERPILLRHVNGHASIANSAALQVANVTNATPDPKGGTFARDSSGEVNGVLLERAHEIVTSAAPDPELDEMVAAILTASERMSALGITTATDMMTGRWDLDRELQAYHLASQRGCKIRLRLYIQWATMLGPRGIDPSERIAAMNPDLCAVKGLKIFADGAIGSATAAIYGEFTGGGNGTLIYEPARLKEMARQGHEAGYAIAIHTIGDRSTDLVMDAIAATDDPARHRIEHAMILSDAQIERMAKLGSKCSMQPEFLMRFGHTYQRQLGPEIANKIKRMRRVKDAGVRLSLSSDRPIVAGNPWDGIWCAVNRPEGFDPAEALTLREAVDGYTIKGAEANDDAGVHGELMPGAWADLQLYDENPLKQRNPSPSAVVRGGAIVKKN